MFGLVLMAAMTCQVEVAKDWHLSSDGKYYYGHVKDGMIHWEPSEQPKLHIRWWVKSCPPDYDTPTVEAILKEASKKWKVAKIAIVKAKSLEDANLIVESYGPTYQGADGVLHQNLAWVGLTEVGSHPFYASGGKAILRINTHYRFHRRHLLNTILHEMGHALGLAHGSRGSVMEPTLEGATELSEEDKEAIRNLYGTSDQP